MAWGLRPEQFFLWNPSLNQNKPDIETPRYDFTYTLSTSVSYCMQLASQTAKPIQTAAPLSPRAAGEIASCMKWFIGYFSCTAQLDILRIEFNKLYKYNPSIKSNCTGYSLGTYYYYATAEDDNSIDDSTPTPVTSSQATPLSGGNRVATLTPIQSGITTNCNKFHKCISGDSYWALSNTYGIALADFYKWNPSVRSDCQTLIPNNYVCVGLISSLGTSKPTLTTKPALISSAPAKPSNVSTNGACSGTGGKMYLNSSFSNCCSSSGYCGSNSTYCGGGCQSKFGKCNTGSNKISPDGTYGGTKGYTYTGSQFRKYCLQYGYCRSATDNYGKGY